MAAERFVPTKAAQQGLALVELLVAMTLTLMIVIAALGTLNVSQRGFASIDASGQLDDNARFAIDVLQKTVGQAGFRDVPFAADGGAPKFALAGQSNPDLFIHGYNNALVRAGTTNEPFAVNDSRSTRCAATSSTECRNGSDVLIVRAQGAMKVVGDPGSTSDKATLTCRGQAATSSAATADDLSTSVFYIDVDSVSKEPALKCLATPAAGGSIIAGSEIPLLQGVESMQVLYGVDGVTARAASRSATDYPPDSPTVYLRADELTVMGNDAATENNWRRVRTVRIGLVLRGPPNSSAGAAVPPQYPLGLALAKGADVGTTLAPPADGRLRRTVSFTVYLHNPQQL